MRTRLIHHRRPGGQPRAHNPAVPLPGASTQRAAREFCTLPHTRDATAQHGRLRRHSTTRCAIVLHAQLQPIRGPAEIHPDETGTIRVPQRIRDCLLRDAVRGGSHAHVELARAGITPLRQLRANARGPRGLKQLRDAIRMSGWPAHPLVPILPQRIKHGARLSEPLAGDLVDAPHALASEPRITVERGRCPVREIHNRRERVSHEIVHITRERGTITRKPQLDASQALVPGRKFPLCLGLPGTTPHARHKADKPRAPDEQGTDGNDVA